MFLTTLPGWAQGVRAMGFSHGSKAALRYLPRRSLSSEVWCSPLLVLPLILEVMWSSSPSWAQKLPETLLVFSYIGEWDNKQGTGQVNRRFHTSPFPKYKYCRQGKTCKVWKTHWDLFVFRNNTCWLFFSVFLSKERENSAHHDSSPPWNKIRKGAVSGSPLGCHFCPWEVRRKSPLWQMTCESVVFACGFRHSLRAERRSILLRNGINFFQGTLKQVFV